MACSALVRDSLYRSRLVFCYFPCSDLCYLSFVGTSFAHSASTRLVKTRNYLVIERIKASINRKGIKERRAKLSVAQRLFDLSNKIEKKNFWAQKLVFDSNLRKTPHLLFLSWKLCSKLEVCRLSSWDRTLDLLFWSLSCDRFAHITVNKLLTWRQNGHTINFKLQNMRSRVRFLLLPVLSLD